MPDSQRIALIVEDDPSTGTLLTRTLGRHGWECQLVGTIEAAATALAAASPPPKLIILDYGLPDGHPWSILELAKAAAPPIPVIVATGMGDENVASECLKHGAIDYIMKGGQFWDLLPRAAERALQVRADHMNASLLTAVVRASPFPVLSTDRKGVIRTWNPAATRLYRYPPGDVVGKPLDQLIPEEERSAAQLQLAHAVGGRRTREESVRRRADGDLVPVISAMAPIYDDQRQLLGVAITEQDLRPQREAARLQRLAGELTRINQELDQFASIAAHDLQAPLRVANLSLDLLSEQLRDSLADGDRELLERSMDAIRRSGAMVTRILGYAREAAADIRHDTEVDPAEVCHTVLGDLAAAIDELGAEIELAQLPAVRFEASQLVRVLQNLLGNAIKYRHPDRPPRITIAEEPCDEPSMVAIAVADNGRGIPADAIPSLFTLYSRAATSGDGTEGYGIGLAVCRKLVEARGGTLICRSEPGVGSTFVMTLPHAGAGDDSGSSMELNPLGSRT